MGWWEYWWYVTYHGRVVSLLGAHAGWLGFESRRVGIFQLCNFGFWGSIRDWSLLIIFRVIHLPCEQRLVARYCKKGVSMMFRCKYAMETKIILVGNADVTRWKENYTYIVNPLYLHRIYKIMGIHFIH